MRRARSTSLAAYTGNTMNVSDEGQPPERFSGIVHLGTTRFKIMRQRPVIGRDFLPEDDRSRRGAGGADRLTACSQNRYGSDPGVDRPIGADQRRADDVIGVMPEGFKFPDNADLWQPLVDRCASLEAQKRNARGLEVFGRLAPGVTPSSRRKAS